MNHLHPASGSITGLRYPARYLFSWQFATCSCPSIRYSVFKDRASSFPGGSKDVAFVREALIATAEQAKIQESIVSQVETFKKRLISGF